MRLTLVTTVALNDLTWILQKRVHSRCVDKCEEIAIAWVETLINLFFQMLCMLLFCILDMLSILGACIGVCLPHMLIELVEFLFNTH